VHYSINDCVHNHKIKISEVNIWVGEDEVEVGVDHGPEEAHSVICRLGRDQDGYTVEERAGGFSPQT
jgi:hypothetical protein